MKISFEKYQGTGNDFILIDIRNHAISDDTAIIAHLCNRHYGIGADGLIILGVSDGYDFYMRYFNADGREASLCGNGGRCITAFAHKLGIIENEAFFKASDGEHRATIISRTGNTSLVKLEMNDVIGANWTNNSIFLDTGSPHLINLCKNLNSVDVIMEGRRLRNDPRFSPQGTNVNFAEEIDNELNIRTYERGVEDETLSCGTGVTAAAIGWAIRKGLNSPVRVRTRGGLLTVSFKKQDRSFKNISLEGDVEYVFSGQIEINAS